MFTRQLHGEKISDLLPAPICSAWFCCFRLQQSIEPFGGENILHWFIGKLLVIHASRVGTAQFAHEVLQPNRICTKRWYANIQHVLLRRQSHEAYMQERSLLKV